MELPATVTNMHQPTSEKAAKPRASFELYDAFAISHFDRRKAPQRTDKKFLDGMTVGHVLHRLRLLSTSGKSSNAAGNNTGGPLDAANARLEMGLKEVTAQAESIDALFRADTFAGVLGAQPAQRFEVVWDDRRFWLIVRMVCAIDKANRQLVRLMVRGAITKDEMKKRQRELARPYRAALQAVVDLASKIEASRTSKTR